MNTIELFSGTKSFSKTTSSLGHQTFTVDNNPSLNPDLVADIGRLTVNQLPYRPEVLWCSPPCEAFSVASIGHHWHPNNTPKTTAAFNSVKLVRHLCHLIDELKPTWVFIENPRGKLRKLGILNYFTRHTVTYCQYGDSRMKPTDIWTNAHWWQLKPACKIGSPCHEAAPRGSRSGTQGRLNAKERGRIPAALFEELFAQLEQHDRDKNTNVNHQAKQQAA